jgi:hypothetical protein
MRQCKEIRCDDINSRVTSSTIMIFYPLRFGPFLVAVTSRILLDLRLPGSRPKVSEAKIQHRLKRMTRNIFRALPPPLMRPCISLQAHRKGSCARCVMPEEFTRRRPERSLRRLQSVTKIIDNCGPCAPRPPSFASKTGWGQWNRGTPSTHPHHTHFRPHRRHFCIR